MQFSRSSRRGPRARTLGIAIALGLAGCFGAAAQGTSAPSHVPPAGALVAPGEAPQVGLLYTGDVVGYIDPCG